MIMNVLAGLTVWTVASVGLGLILGRVMHGYPVGEMPDPPPLAHAESASYRHAA